MYSDAYIEYWGELFVSRDLYRQHGVRFDTFLMAPREILAAVSQVPRSAPLLPAQADAMHRDLQEQMLPDSARLRGDGYIEPLRRHAYDVSADRHTDRRALA